MTEEQGGHHRVSSSLSDFSILELDFEHGSGAGTRGRTESVTLKEIDHIEPNDELPMASLLIVAETEKIDEAKEAGAASGNLLASLGDMDFSFYKLKVKDWDGTKFYSDYIKEGLIYNNKLEEAEKTIMLYESPSSSTAESSFHNKDKYKFHDWPPPTSTISKGLLGPLRYALMSGDTLPVFLRGGEAPNGLIDHWKKTVPGVKVPTFVPKIHTETDTVYSYLPVEQIEHHVNDPTVHYHLAGKDAIHLMTQKTTKLLANTSVSRPCVVKTTHSMGSKGIFIISNDEDEREFEDFLKESGNPTFVVTDFVDIARNVACHFYMHPNGTEITWFGSNENHREADGRFSSDSYLMLNEQADLKKLQLPFIQEVVQYCNSLGFWGFCGCDVLFDSQDNGFLVDINPRVTGSCPALMTLHVFDKTYGFTVGLFRRSGDINFYGSNEELIVKVDAHNVEHEGKNRIVLHSFLQTPTGISRVNIGVYGTDLEECKTILNRFAVPKRNKDELEVVEAGE